MAKPKGKRYDWETVEADYRTGRFSLQQLADKHGPSKTQVARKAREEGWEKDLTQAVQQRTREKLTRNESDLPDTPECDIVERAATENASVVHGHREALAQWRGINERFIRRLTEQLDRGTREVQLKTGDIAEIDLDLDYVGKCIGHGTGALERVVKMERVSYGLDVDTGEGEGKSLQDLMGELAAQEADE
ncbi:hypothetical protein [Salinicola sp. DM10]|uniref:hypothetical protein n=1 Tax=Salinicola sp. DM10 TaxID=2815721 RepID=UPI001A8C4C6D|nr:hypothetical protein [Salinicola sp. DM10]MCE3025738.1 hypothetical protein [Salinicola sp. DM10]